MHCLLAIFEYFNQTILCTIVRPAGELQWNSIWDFIRSIFILSHRQWWRQSKPITNMHEKYNYYFAQPYNWNLLWLDANICIGRLCDCRVARTPHRVGFIRKILFFSQLDVRRLHGTIAARWMWLLKDNTPRHCTIRLFIMQILARMSADCSKQIGYFVAVEAHAMR